MQIGLIGCGNMGRALARGWRRPLLCADPIAERARALAAEVSGEALQSNVEVRQGAVVQAVDAGGEQWPLDSQVGELFADLGMLVELDDALIDVAMGLMSCAPAYVALVAEAQVDAGVRRGIPPAQGAQLVVQTLAGTAELLRRRGFDIVSVRREVTSPGGLTARGLDALERAGLRAAFSDAMDAVLGQ